VSRKRLNICADDIINKYTSGMSVKQVADFFKISRGAVVSRLHDVGIIQRDRSESMYLRMSNLTFEERKKLTKKANETLVGTNQPIEGRIKRAEGVQKSLSKVGKGEDILQGWLEQRGLNVVPQLAVNIFNIDLAIKPIAVELLCAAAYPLSRPFDRNKIKYLCNHGWLVIYITVWKASQMTERCADYVKSCFDILQSDPSMIGQYRMVRGSGDVYSFGSGDFD
jgi:hypothetical protein